MSKLFHTCILTRGRVDRQFTLTNLAPEIRSFVTVYCYEGEREALEKLWGRDVCEIVEYPTYCDHVGKIRDWVIDNVDADAILFMDDNLKFQVRAEPNHGEHTKFPLYIMNDSHFTAQNIMGHQYRMIQWLFIKVTDDSYGISGLSPRTGNNRHEADEEENSRIYGIWAINKKLYKLQQERFKNWELKEDFAVQLGMLTMGIPTIVSYKYAFDKQRGANAKGGCSTYRTIERSNEAAKRLSEHFPDYVRITRKSAKNWGGEFKNQTEMLDVAIQWKKAYADGLLWLEL